VKKKKRAWHNNSNLLSLVDPTLQPSMSLSRNTHQFVISCCEKKDTHTCANSPTVFAWRRSLSLFVCLHIHFLSPHNIISTPERVVVEPPLSQHTRTKGSLPNRNATQDARKSPLSRWLLLPTEPVWWCGPRPIIRPPIRVRLVAEKGVWHRE